MKKANNNKTRRWVDIVIKGERNQNLYGYVAYYLPEKTPGLSAKAVVFTTEGEFLRVEYLTRCEKMTDIDPPKWAANMYYIERKADSLGDGAVLFDARYKSLIGFNYEEKLRKHLSWLQKQLNYFNSIKDSEPWA